MRTEQISRQHWSARRYAETGHFGEFSFMISALGITHRLLSPEAQNLILAGALISITLNLAVFRLAGILRRRLDRAQPP